MRTGYSERAHVAYQLLLELNLFCPTSLVDASLEDKLEGLSTFYDSEAPRLGEEGATGWANTSPDALPFETTSTFPTSDPESVSPGDSDFSRWAAAEARESARRPYTSRLTTTEDTEADDAEDDVYRYVMFADVSNVLFLVPVDTIARQHLVYLYLNFIGLPVHAPSLSTNEMSTASMVFEPISDQQAFFGKPATDAPAFEIIGGEPMEAVRRGGVTSPTEVYGTNWPASIDTLFSSSSFDWFLIWTESGPAQELGHNLVRCVMLSLLRVPLAYIWV